MDHASDPMLAHLLRSGRLLASIPLVATLAHAQTAMSASIAVTVQAQTNPPQLQFSWPSDPTATSYTVRKRIAGTSQWAAHPVAGGGTATSWTDANVVVGQRYEYYVLRLGNPSGRCFLTAGVESDLVEDRGIVILIVDDTKVQALGSRLDRLQQDLVGDGWRVLRHDVSPGDAVVDVKNLILADVAAHPAEVDAVFLLGHVPVPYSGLMNPDGHGNHFGAWAADVFYGELDGNWTDTTVFNTSASRPQNHNVPGDGKYDQNTIPTTVELAVGRVDLHDMPAFAASEEQLLQQYLDKDHDYRHKVFTAQQRAVVDDHFGWFSGEAFAASGWRNFTALVGAADTMAGDYFTTLNTTGAGHVWSYGCGGGSYTSAGGIGNTAQFAGSSNRNVFTMLFGSYFGDWDSTNNFLRAPLGSGWTLGSAWAGRPHWQFHAMGMGSTIGHGCRYSQNDTSAGGLFPRYAHMALMGDPTLRQHVVAPPAAATASANGNGIDVSWTGSPDPVVGYHVYRASAPAGPFVRLTAAPVAATTFTDPAPPTGNPTYMVRALRLEATPTGSYWNLSQGAFVDTCAAIAASHTVYGTGCYQPDELTLAAAPPPVSGPAIGTQLVYTIDNVPPAAPGSNVHFGVVTISFTKDLAGTSLTGLGLPGCSLYVGSLDLNLSFQSPGSQASTTVWIPPGLPCGSAFYATAAALFVPGSLPNGQNPFGAVTSNGVHSLIAPN